LRRMCTVCCITSWPMRHTVGTPSKDLHSSRTIPRCTVQTAFSSTEHRRRFPLPDLKKRFRNGREPNDSLVFTAFPHSSPCAHTCAAAPRLPDRSPATFPVLQVYSRFILCFVRFPLDAHCVAVQQCAHVAFSSFSRLL